jgi:hypothetical protein
MLRLGSVSIITAILLILIAGTALAIKSGNLKLSDKVSMPSFIVKATPAPQVSMLPPSSATPIPQSSSTPSSSVMANIVLSQPKDGDNVSKQFTIKGMARVFENVLQVRVKNQRTNAVYLKQNIEANSSDVGQFGDFSYNVNLSNQTDLRVNDKLSVEAFQNSAKDGSEIDITSITINYTGQ